VGRNRIIVLIATCIAIGMMLFAFSFPGLIFGANEIINNFSTSNIELHHTKIPLGSVEAVSVDSSGNIYIGINQRGSIHNSGSVQVYDNNGRFLYRVSFPKWTGMFFFYVDDNDILRVFPARGRNVFSFVEGELISSEPPADRNTTIEHFRYKQQTTQFVDRYGNTYTRTGFSNRNFRMYDTCGYFIRTIRPNAPILPLPFSLSLLMCASGFVFTAVTIKLIFKAKKEEAKQAK